MRTSGIDYIYFFSALKNILALKALILEGINLSGLANSAWLPTALLQIKHTKDI